MACFVRCEVMVWAVEASGGGANQVVLRLQCERWYCGREGGFDPPLTEL